MEDAPVQPPPPPDPATRPPGTARTAPLREFIRKRKKTTVGDLFIPLMAIALAFSLFYVLSQRRLIANVMALNDSDKPLTLQVNMERLHVHPGGSDKMAVYHVNGEFMDVLSGGGTVESVRLPDITPAWVIYNMQGRSSAVVVDYTWAYGADGKRSSSGPQFKVLANLKKDKLFTFGDAVVLGPNDPLPTTYADQRPLLKVERVPDPSTPEPYLREKLPQL